VDKQVSTTRIEDAQRCLGSVLTLADALLELAGRVIRGIEESAPQPSGDRDSLPTRLRAVLGLWLLGRAAGRTTSTE
jgi:hypothetical protein